MNERSIAAVLKVLAVLVLVVVCSTIAFGLGVGLGARFPGALSAFEGRVVSPAAASQPLPTATATVSDTATSGNLVDMGLFREAWILLQKQYYGDLPQGKDITYAAIRGLVAGLGDPHTAFLDPVNADLFNRSLEGQFDGIGMQVSQAAGGGVTVSYLFPDQPAEKSGLHIGDVITEVDGKDITRLSLTEAVTQIRGPSGTSVRLTVHRVDNPVLEITVTRAHIEIPVVSSKTVGDGKIAYVALSEFSNIAPSRLADAVNKVLAAKPSGLILDLRGNPGGLLDAAVRIGSNFVPQGNIVLERSKDGTEKVYEREGRYLLGKTPLVVLIDGGSASASEIVAGAIQDAGTGVLIGERSYGKGSVQLPNTLSDGSQLRITIAHWFTPKNRAIDKVGLTPDVEVQLTQADMAAGRDPQLERAIRWLQGDHTLPTPTPGTPQPAATPGGTP